MQGNLPKGEVVTSGHTDAITHPDDVLPEDVAGLLEVQSLEVGDLVYLPRGTVHRGRGGALEVVK